MIFYTWFRGGSTETLLYLLSTFSVEVSAIRQPFKGSRSLVEMPDIGDKLVFSQ